MGARGALRVRSLTAVDLRRARTQHTGNPVGRWVALLEVTREGFLGRITVGQREPANRAIRLEQMDDAPVGQGAHGHPRDFLQRG